jgi:hypothetical protein
MNVLGSALLLSGDDDVDAQTGAQVLQWRIAAYLL